MQHLQLCLCASSLPTPRQSVLLLPHLDPSRICYAALLISRHISGSQFVCPAIGRIGIYSSQTRFITSYMFLSDDYNLAFCRIQARFLFPLAHALLKLSPFSCVFCRQKVMGLLEKLTKRFSEPLGHLRSLIKSLLEKLFGLLKSS